MIVEFALIRKSESLIPLILVEPIESADYHTSKKHSDKEKKGNEKIARDESDEGLILSYRTLHLVDYEAGGCDGHEGEQCDRNRHNESADRCHPTVSPAEGERIACGQEHCADGFFEFAHCPPLVGVPSRILGSNWQRTRQSNRHIPPLIISYLIPICQPNVMFQDLRNT